MKYFITEEYIYSDNIINEISVKHKTRPKESGRIFSIAKTGYDTIELTEGCDATFAITLSKEEAVALFQEAIDWIKKD